MIGLKSIWLILLWLVGYTFIIMGMIASIFISNLIQMSSQWELIMTMIVPSILVDRIMIKIIGFISMEKDINQHFRGMGR